MPPVVCDNPLAITISEKTDTNNREMLCFQKNYLLYPKKRITFLPMKTTTALFKALAHQTRLNILSLLLDGEVCVCQITAILQLPQSTASRHLAILKNAGLVKDRPDGTWVHYSLAKGHSALADQLLEALKEHLPKTREGAQNRQKLSEALQKSSCA
jgi:ArsR family transcriptional regulator